MSCQQLASEGVTSGSDRSQALSRAIHTVCQATLRTLCDAVLLSARTAVKCVVDDVVKELRSGRFVMHTHVEVPIHTSTFLHRDVPALQDWGVEGVLEALQAAHTVLLALAPSAPALKSTCAAVAVACPSTHPRITPGRCLHCVRWSWHIVCRVFRALGAAFRLLPRCPHLATEAQKQRRYFASIEQPHSWRVVAWRSCSSSYGNTIGMLCFYPARFGHHPLLQLAVAPARMGVGVDRSRAGVCLVHAHGSAGGPDGGNRRASSGARGSSGGP